MAYVHLVGLGLDAWALDQSVQADLMLQLYNSLLVEHSLPNVGTLDFSSFPENCNRGLLRHARIRVCFSHRNPEDPVGPDELLVAMQSWNANAFPGNEFWDSHLDDVGSPVARCSAIAMLQNPDINPRLQRKEAICILGTPSTRSEPQEYEVMDLSEFQSWRLSNKGDMAHVHGFTRGMSRLYHSTALWDLRHCSLLAWDGDRLDGSSFTSFITAFLRERSDRQAVAFRKRDAIARFQEEWSHQAVEFKGRIIVVSVDVEQDASLHGLEAELSRVERLPAQWAQDLYMLGLISLKATGSRQALAFGGNSLLGVLAEASFADGVHWTVFALNRGEKESKPSLMDWAVKMKHPNLTFIYWKDPNYIDAFHGEAPPRYPFQVLTLTDFYKWRVTNTGDIMHIKGFASGTSDCYSGSALSALSGCKLLAWTGEAPDATAFTSLVPAFLREAQDNRVLAFQTSGDGVDRVQATWQKYAKDFRRRVIIVSVDLEKDAVQLGLSCESYEAGRAGRLSDFPPWAQDKFMLGRIALRATGSKRVISLGGGGVVGLEADASLPDNVHWTIFGLARGRKELFPSLMDWAATVDSPNVSFVYWKDPKYADAFAGTAPPVSHVQVVDLGGFHAWRSTNTGKIVHVKGFGSGMSDCFNDDALSLLESCSIIVWDGDPPNDTGFTALVTIFLRERSERKAVAFRKIGTVDEFQTDWQEQAADFRDRLLVVTLDPAVDIPRFPCLSAEFGRLGAFPKWAQECYVLGRMALKATASKQVIALGGGGVVGQEAEASFSDGVQWAVYALSRGQKEQHPTIMDWAFKTRSSNLLFLCGKDPKYADAFAGKAPQWLITQSHNLCGPGEESRFAGKVMLLPQVKKVIHAVQRLNENPSLCPEGYCIVFSEANKRYILLHRLDKQREAFAMFKLDVSVSPRASRHILRALVPEWSVDQSEDLCGIGEDSSWEGFRLLEINSVEKAIEDLNRNRSLCPEGICVLFAEAKMRYFVLYRSDKEWPPPPPTELCYAKLRSEYGVKELVRVNATVRGIVDSYTVEPPLPPGLTLGAADGSIRGSPTKISEDKTYKITAQSRWGSCSTMICFRVQAARLVSARAALAHAVASRKLRELRTAIAEAKASGVDDAEVGEAEVLLPLLLEEEKQLKAREALNAAIKTRRREHLIAAIRQGELAGLQETEMIVAKEVAHAVLVDYPDRNPSGWSSYVWSWEMFCCMNRDPETSARRPGGSLLSAAESPRVESPRALESLHMADNSQLRAETDGIGYRMSKNYKDLDPTKLQCPWNERIYGTPEAAADEGPSAPKSWLRVRVEAEPKKGREAGIRYLPFELDGVRVLRRVHDFRAWSAAAPRNQTPPPHLARAAAAFSDGVHSEQPSPRRPRGHGARSSTPRSASPFRALGSARSTPRTPPVTFRDASSQLSRERVTGLRPLFARFGLEPLSARTERWAEERGAARADDLPELLDELRVFLQALPLEPAQRGDAERLLTALGGSSCELVSHEPSFGSSAAPPTFRSAIRN